MTASSDHPDVRVVHVATGASPQRASRVVSALVFAACAAVLGVAWVLAPDPRGLGTHEQLGLPPCGFMLQTGLPCVTCGMTTSFSHAAHGDLLGAVRAQPAGAVLAVLVAAAMIVSGYAVVTGVDVRPVWNWAFRPVPMLGLGALMLGAWAYKMVSALGN